MTTKCLKSPSANGRPPTPARWPPTSATTGNAAAPSGAYDATTYGYHPTGELAKVSDGSGNVCPYTHDQRGRLTETSDPDKGVTKTGYDNLDRVTQTRDGSATGALLTEFAYDTLRKGAITSATRWSGGQASTNTVNIYDTMGRATRTTVTIPSAEGSLAGSYQFNTSYNLDGTVQGIGYPTGGGMARRRRGLRLRRAAASHHAHLEPGHIRQGHHLRPDPSLSIKL
ncbi:hypothetical protein AB0I80_53795 [Nonomuraea rubra]